MEAFSKAFEDLRALPLVADEQSKEAFIVAFRKLTPDEQEEQAFLYWHSATQRNKQILVGINRANKTHTALSKGRELGGYVIKERSTAKHQLIQRVVNQFLAAPEKEIGFNLPKARFATLDDMVVAIKKADLKTGFRDSTLRRSVAKAMTDYKNQHK